MIKGELVEIVHKGKEENTNWWEYGIVINSFDNNVQITTESKKNIMWYYKEKTTDENKLDDSWFNGDFQVLKLFKNNEVVMAKKTIFGNYKFN